MNIVIVDNADIIKAAKEILLTGVLCYHDSDGYTYVKVSDDFYKLTKYIKPDLGSPDPISNIGAHISVVYPWEIDSTLMQSRIEAMVISNPSFKVDFTPLKLCRAQYNNQVYYVITLVSKEIDSFREKLQLSKQLSFKGYLVPTHITLAKEV